MDVPTGTAMRSSLRSLLLIAFVACHSTVMSAGPSLHGLLGLDHGSSWGSVAPGDGSKALGHASHDCAACHLLSLVQHNPDAVVAYSTPQTDRVARPLRAPVPPRESRAVAPSRAPPAAMPFLSIA